MRSYIHFDRGEDDNFFGVKPYHQRRWGATHKRISHGKYKGHYKVTWRNESNSEGPIPLPFKHRRRQW